MTTYWNHTALDRLPHGAVIRDRRGVTALHIDTDRWLAILNDGHTDLIATVPTQVFTLPATLHPATKEATR